MIGYLSHTFYMVVNKEQNTEDSIYVPQNVPRS